MDPHCSLQLDEVDREVARWRARERRAVGDLTTTTTTRPPPEPEFFNDRKFFANDEPQSDIPEGETVRQHTARGANPGSGVGGAG